MVPEAWMSSSTKCLLLSLAILLSCSCAITAQGAQSNTGDYTAALPSVDTIKAQIKGTDPTDTLARQIAVFRSLRNYISNIAYTRSVKAPPTPSEQKALTAYGLAETQLTQSYTSTHTPDEVKAFNQLCGRYLFNDDLYNQYHRLMGKQAVDAMQSAEAKEAQSVQRMQQRMSAGNRPSAGNSAGTLGSGLPSAENAPKSAVASNSGAERSTIVRMPA